MTDAPRRRARGTLASIAAEVGVSRTTVSNAYNRPGQLSPELREHILAVARRQGYPGPDPMARNLRTRRAGAVGVLFTEELSFAFEDTASVDFLAGLAAECGARESSLLVIPASSGAGEAGADLIRGAAVDSMVVYSVADDDPFLDIVARRGLPTVICDQPTDRADLPFVGIDDRAAIRPAVRRLVELGHRRVGILSVRLSRTQRDGPVHRRDLAEAHHHVQRFRIEGALAELAAGGVDPDAVPIIGRHLNTPAANDSAAAELLDAHPGLTAVVCTTDTQALAVLRAAAARGIRVPEELSVTGFDGIGLARAANLTTIVQPNREKGRAAGRALFAEGPRRVLLGTRLEPGGTVAPPRPDAADR
ncbi:LacI family DNA-binding transcriptional regulator [Corynebacterium sphenisci]|uniref:LacI family DNA-binding transcriptional regulator n=1 Tax=Corynebacterium sphenisci TaxID=191493 RepID=UPI0026DF6D77|nr:LacI family DNA-binding transcriptional regulator [Corynebacterium sphenisci]MDO5730125.1 LacI family DNA-binding transcriptional regulator [Corynebacterium sphenisci]